MAEVVYKTKSKILATSLGSLFLQVNDKRLKSKINDLGFEIMKSARKSSLTLQDALDWFQRKENGVEFLYTFPKFGEKAYVLFFTLLLHAGVKKEDIKNYKEKYNPPRPKSSKRRRR